MNKMDTVKDMIICSAYRYAIGRSSYVITLSSDIPKRYYNEFSDRRKEFIANDIRKTLLDKINWQICNLTIHRPDSSYSFNPIATLLEFIEQKQIKSEEELRDYNDIEYFADKGEYKYSKYSENNHFMDISSINDLIPWERFASCFNVNEYKYFEGKPYFRSWRRKSKKDDFYNIYTYEKFGWEPEWIRLESFLKDDYIISYNEKTFYEKIKDEK